MWKSNHVKNNLPWLVNFLLNDQKTKKWLAIEFHQIQQLKQIGIPPINVTEISKWLLSMPIIQKGLSPF